MRRFRPALLALALVFPACKSGGAASGDPQSVSAHSQPPDPNVISGDQIQEAISSGLGNAYDLVARLHPSWMRTTSSRGVQVWLDNQRYGGIATLRNVSLTTVSFIRYMGPSEAQGMLGMDNQGGAIVLTTVR